MSLYTDEELEAYDQLEVEARQRYFERASRHKIPEIALEPTGGEVLVCRIEAEERKTASGIVVPRFVGVSDRDEGGLGKNVSMEQVILNIGVLMRGGLEAMDWMRTNGYFVGDYVVFARYAGEENKTHFMDPDSPEAPAADNVLRLHVRNLGGSIDLGKRLRGPNPVMKHVFLPNVGKGEYFIKPIVRK